MITEPAPAKLNLYLHITGRRADGYHDLDSLVAFAGAGDEVWLEPAEAFSFHIEGPQAVALKGHDKDANLVVKAARSLAELTGKKLNVKLTLIKNLPVASGIGGGSSDAAAVLRALAKHWGLPLSDPRLYEAAAAHGQDVPVCLRIENAYLTATGHTSAPPLPYADILLINPNKALPTPDVYKAYRTADLAFSPSAQLKEAPKDLDALIEALEERGNDLASAAAALMPEIKDILTVLAESEDCFFRQMSGSGATCFGIFKDRNAARKAAAAIFEAHPHWWITQTYLPCRTDPRQFAG